MTLSTAVLKYNYDYDTATQIQAQADSIRDMPLRTLIDRMLCHDPTELALCWDLKYLHVEWVRRFGDLLLETVICYPTRSVQFYDPNELSGQIRHKGEWSKPRPRRSLSERYEPESNSWGY